MVTIYQALHWEISSREQAGGSARSCLYLAAGSDIHTCGRSSKTLAVGRLRRFFGSVSATGRSLWEFCWCNSKIPRESREVWMNSLPEQGKISWKTGARCGSGRRTWLVSSSTASPLLMQMWDSVNSQQPDPRSIGFHMDGSRGEARRVGYVHTFFF